MGNREILFVDNGMDTEKMKRMGTITNDTNAYRVRYNTVV